MSCWLAPSTTTASGLRCAPVSTLRLTPLLPRSLGLGPVIFPSQGSLGHRAIECKPGPVDPVECLHPQQAQAPELLECDRLRPRLKAPMRRTARSNSPRIERIPLPPVRSTNTMAFIAERSLSHARVVAAQRVRLARRPQRRYLLPYLIGQPPSIVWFDHVHGLSSFFITKVGLKLTAIYLSISFCRDRFQAVYLA